MSTKGESGRALTAGRRRAVLGVMSLSLMMVVAAVASLTSLCGTALRR